MNRTARYQRDGVTYTVACIHAPVSSPRYRRGEAVTLIPEGGGMSYWVLVDQLSTYEFQIVEDEQK